MKAIGTPTNIPLIGWVLVAVAIMHWYQPLVATYNVAEHRLDYIKLGEGREYNYHYNDGVSSGYDKRKFYKRPQALKQPYTLKSFASPVEQIATNEFQTQPQQTYMTQESLLPVYESHEKTVSFVPAEYSSSKPATAQRESPYTLTQSTGPVSYTGSLAERVIQRIQLHHPPSVKNISVPTSISSSSGIISGSTAHFQSSGVQYNQHPGSYQYFNAHPAPTEYELVRPISNFPPPRPYIAPTLTTTKAPYVAPFLQRTSTTTTTTTTTPAPPSRRPPYVAPGVTNDPLLSSVSLANQLKYSSSSRPTTANRPAATASNGSGNPTLQPYEPEFDIDIRIDLRDDSA
ncbi:mucin-5AC-like isoform X1 [Anopheles gambiae]|uniref:mucin-5AC-like isoform X1 n=2 Tax=Anopheles gambiae TaxID=7165 RepID=UPI002AC95C8F|nr:mucin-5AC-like isoform X1 [Anopheles gambiae]